MMEQLRSHLLATCVALGTALSAPAAALAAGSAEDTPLHLQQTQARVSEVTSSGGGLGRALAGLALVVALIFALQWVLKKVQNGRVGRADGPGLTPVASVALGRRGELHLVRAGNEVVLVGTADGAVVHLRRYSEDEARAAGLLGSEDATPRAAASEVPWLARLRQLTVRG